MRYTFPPDRFMDCGLGCTQGAQHSRARGPLQVVPGQCSANSTVFSGFDAALQPGVAPGGLAAAADLLASTQKQSMTESGLLTTTQTVLEARKCLNEC